MGDSAKQKSSSWTSSCGINSQNTTSQNSQDFLPWANQEAQILASPSLVSSAKDAWSWLEKKGWALNSEIYSKSKLADILLLATLSFKLPAKADTAIHSVAFLIWD